MKDDTISRQAAIRIASGFCHPANIAKELAKLPSAQPEHLCVVMDKISKAYEKAMNTPCIHNPMAWALYQVWKEYDR